MISPVLVVAVLRSGYGSVFIENSPLAGELFLNHVEWEDAPWLVLMVERNVQASCYLLSPFATSTLPFCLELNPILTSETVFRKVI